MDRVQLTAAEDPFGVLAAHLATALEREWVRRGKNPYAGYIALSSESDPANSAVMARDGIQWRVNDFWLGARFSTKLSDLAALGKATGKVKAVRTLIERALVVQSGSSPRLEHTNVRLTGTAAEMAELWAGHVEVVRGWLERDCTARRALVELGPNDKGFREALDKSVRDLAQLKQ